MQNKADKNRTAPPPLDGASAPPNPGRRRRRPVIRSWRPDDQPAVWRLYAEGRLLSHDVPGEEAHDLRDMVGTYFAHPRNHFWVAEAEGRIVGMIGVAENDRHAVEIRRLRVEASWRDSDLATRLVEVAVEHCRRHSVLKVVLSTSLARQTASALFGQKGLLYTRNRQINGREVLEFYINLYQKLEPQTEQELADLSRLNERFLPQPPTL